jgi:hypothetical protein
MSINYDEVSEKDYTLRCFSARSPSDGPVIPLTVQAKCFMSESLFSTRSHSLAN